MWSQIWICNGYTGFIRWSSSMEGQIIFYCDSQFAETTEERDAFSILVYAAPRLGHRIAIWWTLSKSASLEELQKVLGHSSSGWDLQWALECDTAVSSSLIMRFWCQPLWFSRWTLNSANKTHLKVSLSPLTLVQFFREICSLKFLHFPGQKRIERCFPFLKNISL